MALIRARQRALTAVSPHNASGPYLVPKRSSIPPDPPPPPDFLVFGPFVTGFSGTRFWLRVPEGAVTNAEAWQIGFDVDGDPDPDVWVSLVGLLYQLDLEGRRYVRARARENGWTG